MRSGNGSEEEEEEYGEGVLDDMWYDAFGGSSAEAGPAPSEAQVSVCSPPVMRRRGSIGVNAPFPLVC